MSVVSLKIVFLCDDYVSQRGANFKYFCIINKKPISLSKSTFSPTISFILRQMEVKYQDNIVQKGVKTGHLNYIYFFKVIGIRPLVPVQNSVSLKLIQRETLNFVINLPDVENLTK